MKINNPTSSPITKTVILTRDMVAATGAIATTGIGFKPSRLDVIAVLSGSAGSAMAWGIMDTASFVQCLYTDGFSGNSYGTTLMTISNSLATNQKISTASFDPDGFTLNWTRNGTTLAGTINFIVTASK